jgi:hypothetical protein
VIDQHGLTVASRGPFENDDVEATGTRLMIAFGQADRMSLGDGRARQMSIQLGELWITGVHVSFRDDSTFTFGFAGARPLDKTIRGLLEDVIGVLVERFFEPGALEEHQGDGADASPEPSAAPLRPASPDAQP